jgi:hypothetical protein
MPAPFGGGRLETVPAPKGGRQDLFIGPAQLMSSGRKGVGYSWDLVREYEQKYKVFTRHKLVGPNGCCYCPGLPLGYAPYNSPWGVESDPDALAVRFQAEMQEQDEGAWDVWIVTVTFSTVVPEGGVPEYPAESDTTWAPGMAGGKWAAGIPRKIGAQTRPDMVAPVVKWDEEVMHRSPPYDLGISEGDPLGEPARGPIPFQNAANIGISPAPVFDYPYSVLSVTRNEINFNKSRLLSYAMAYNSDYFLDAPPGCAQFLVSRAELKFHGRTYYHRVTYRIRFTPEDVYLPVEPDDVDYDPEVPDAVRRIRWNDIESSFLNAGMHEVFDDYSLAAVVGGVGPSKKRWRPVLDASGHPTTVPRPLYGKDSDTGASIAYKKGQAIPIHLLKDPVLYEHKPNYLKFRVRPFKPFAVLFVRGLQMPVNIMTVPAGAAQPGPKYWLTDPTTSTTPPP